MEKEVKNIIKLHGDDLNIDLISSSHIHQLSSLSTIAYSAVYVAVGRRDERKNIIWF